MRSVGLRHLQCCAAVVGSAVVLSGLCSGAAIASSTRDSPAGKVSVPQGLNPTRIRGATRVGPTVPATKMTVSFILKAQNLSALEAEVTAGWTGPYLTATQFARQYGQTPQIVGELESYLSRYGITSTADADDLDVTARGTAAEFDRALSIVIDTFTVPGRGDAPAQKVYASSADPTVSGGFALDILSILGLSDYAPFASQAEPAKTSAGTTAAPAGDGGIPLGERTPADFESQYGLNSLQATGAVGQGETLGIVTLASVNPNVPQRFWNMLGLTTKANRTTLDDIDGGPGPVSLAAGSDETTLDVEQSGAIAPQANITVYQAPNTDYGFVDAYFAAASQNAAESVSSSWGESETVLAGSVATGTESATYAQSFDEAFLELAAQGESNFVATGDFGAYQDDSDLGTTALSADTPSDSPYTTAAGGTTNQGIQTYPVINARGRTTAVDQVNIPEQITWGWDYLWPLYAAFGAPGEKAVATDFGFDEGSNGGYSSIEPRPSYQDAVSGVGSYDAYPYLTPTDETSVDNLTEPTEFSLTPVPSLGSATAPAGRATPDLAFDGDPQTGYALYDPQFESFYGTKIEQYGGTSFVAPQLNAVSAVYESALGHRIGFWNPTIYAAAQSPSSPFTPIDIDQQFSGSEYLSTTRDSTGRSSALPGSFASDNLYYTGTPGTVYNPGSGLGYANLGALETDFASR